jgi:hypothetical protein
MYPSQQQANDSCQQQVEYGLFHDLVKVVILVKNIYKPPFYPLSLSCDHSPFSSSL